MPPPGILRDASRKRGFSNVALVTGAEWGQGKTDCMLDLTALLLQRHRRVGGFCLRRVWEPSPEGFALHGVEAFLLSSGESIPVARREYRAHEVAPIRTDRRSGFHLGYEEPFHIDHDGLAQLLEAARRDIDEGDLDVFIYDELGPLLLKSKTHRDRTQRFYELALHPFESGVPGIVLVFSDEEVQTRGVLGVHQYLRAQRYMERATQILLTRDTYATAAHKILFALEDESVVPD